MMVIVFLKILSVRQVNKQVLCALIANLVISMIRVYSNVLNAHDFLLDV